MRRYLVWRAIGFLGILISLTNQLGAIDVNSAGEIFVWPSQVAPGSETLTIKQETLERSRNPAKELDRAVIKVTKPSLTVYRPAKSNGIGILVMPGGSYQRVVLDKEGSDLAAPFNAAGYTLFVLTYRLPGDGHASGRDAPLADAQRALRLIRSKAATWGLQPDRIGAMGFSAGGHVAASLATKFDQPTYSPIDATDQASARPDFLILGYPVISMKTGLAHSDSRRELLGKDPTEDLVTRYSLETQVNAQTPPTFVMLASDDNSVNPENGIEFFKAVRRQKIQAELHVFQEGGHGFGIRGVVGKPAARWPQMVLDWLAAKL